MKSALERNIYMELPTTAVSDELWRHKFIFWERHKKKIKTKIEYRTKGRSSKGKEWGGSTRLLDNFTNHFAHQTSKKFLNWARIVEHFNRDDAHASALHSTTHATVLENAIAVKHSRAFCTRNYSQKMSHNITQNMLDNKVGNEGSALFNYLIFNSHSTPSM